MSTPAEPLADEAAILAALREALGEAAVATDADTCAAYGLDRSTRWQADPLCVLRPQSVEQVQSIVRLARRLRFAIVPSGGRTGLAGGAVAARREVLLSLERMRKLHPVDRVERCIRVEAGAAIGQVQQAAAEAGLYYPVDWAAAGSAQVGGSLATNAGGVHVIRYGMTRDWVRGLRVVTGHGELIDCQRDLIKNNSGYDLRHLMIGSEGTLGIIVEATLALTAPPQDPGVALLALPDLPAALRVYERAREGLPLSACEFFTASALARVQQRMQLPPPFAEAAPAYLLLEWTQAEAHTDAAEALFADCFEAGTAVDGALAQSGAQAQALWRYREDISEALAPEAPYKNDVSVRAARLPEFIARIEQDLAADFPALELVCFGHLGDGNLHLNLLPRAALAPQDWAAQSAQAGALVARRLEDYAGSVSAEHGIGLLKREQLGHSRSAHEVELMRGIKAAFDPDQVLNPGKIFPVAD